MSGQSVSTLAQLVQYVQHTSNARTSSGNCKITSDIGIGWTGWIRFFAMWQNHYDQANYDINLELIYTGGSNASNVSVYHCMINGKNGTYNVVKYGRIDNYSKGITSTIVWENSDPVGNTNMASATDTVTPTYKDISGYTFIQIKFRPLTTSSTVTFLFTPMYSVDRLISDIWGYNYMQSVTGGTIRYREWHITTNSDGTKSISFGAGYSLAIGETSATLQKSVCIPVQIIGYK